MSSEVIKLERWQSGARTGAVVPATVQHSLPVVPAPGRQKQNDVSSPSV